ncbi:telomere repeats-binding bouquet formation protein 1 [Lampris incognitus]|uniref:telomere repeats-binding bouquet formation protein 1 n=1 Tax=Lampris incognitus TaxID=2546036 RepID=UPI0024B5C5E7|nr:telomere repeats-binding bouquet formation protein 1 [Lampris incognitus]
MRSYRERVLDASSNDYNAAKTDLTLLLDCLKFQMKSPDLQKQALLTIHSVCQNREENVDLFREMGGVEFVFSLTKSSIHSVVKETSLFTLAALAETSVYCKNSLCRKEIFSDLADWLVKEDSSLIQKRVAVYLLSVLVSNNKSGQTLAQTTNCMDVLLDLFRSTSPLSKDATLGPANNTQTYQLWISVSSALSGCVNNPQNEEAQRICVAAFPLVKTWLEQITLFRSEVVQPICSFIAMTVSNNSFVQENFFASGGLETLILTLVRLASDAEKSPLSCHLAVIMTKTLSACISDNSTLATGLFQHGVVSALLSLLSSPNLDPQDRLSVVLTLGHCTEVSEENQSQLVALGGLSIIITLLTESQSEDLRRASAFILQTCKKATMSLATLDHSAKQSEDGAVDLRTNLAWRSARDLLHRINQLEKREAEGVKDKEAEGSPVQAEELIHAGRMSSREKTAGGEAYKDVAGGSYAELDRCEEHCREDTLRKSDPERRSSENTRAGRNWMEEIQHRGRSPQSLSRIWRQVFEDKNETEESAVTSRVKEERGAVIPSKQKEKSNTGHVTERQIKASVGVKAEDDPHCEPQTLGRALRRAGDSSESKSGGCSGALVKSTKEHYQYVGGDTSSAPVAHTEIGVPGQAPLGGDVTCSMCRGTGRVSSSHIKPREGAREPHVDSQLFKHPPPVKQKSSGEKRRIDDDDALSLCSELIDSEISNMKSALEFLTPPHNRCSGCMLHFGEVTSRSFWFSQSYCHQRCDMHKVLQEATDAFRARRQDMLFSKKAQSSVEHIDTCSEGAAEARPKRSLDYWREVSLMPIRKDGEPPRSSPGKWQRKNYNDIQLTPLRRGAQMRAAFHDGKSVTAERPHLPEAVGRTDENGGRALDDQPEPEPKPELGKSNRRERKNFTQEEVYYLLHGVKRFGASWNSILWSYPFQHGRTNVDLARKYRQLMLMLGGRK